MNPFVKQHFGVIYLLDAPRLDDPLGLASYPMDSNQDGTS